MTRKQHYIPRFYLERFTDSSRKLWIYDASRDIVFEKSPEGACVRTDLYETEWIEANEKLGKYVLPNDIEDLYSRYEAEFSAFLRELDHILIRDQLLNASICSAKNRRLMFRFIANLLFRNPKTMEEYKLSEVDTGILGEDGTNELCEILDKMGIAVRSGQMCAEPTMDRFGVTGMLRASLAPYNTMEEAEYFNKSLDRAINMLR